MFSQLLINLSLSHIMSSIKLTTHNILSCPFLSQNPWGLFINLLLSSFSLFYKIFNSLRNWTFRADKKWLIEAFFWLLNSQKLLNCVFHLLFRLCLIEKPLGCFFFHLFKYFGVRLHINSWFLWFTNVYPFIQSLFCRCGIIKLLNFFSD